MLIDFFSKKLLSNKRMHKSDDIIYAMPQRPPAWGNCESVANIPYKLSPGSYHMEFTWKYTNNFNGNLHGILLTLANTPWITYDSMPSVFENHFITETYGYYVSCSTNVTTTNTNINYVILDLFKQFTYDIIEFELTSYKITKQ